jgi:hypothetical protein
LKLPASLLFKNPPLSPILASAALPPSSFHAKNSVDPQFPGPSATVLSGEVAAAGEGVLEVDRTVRAAASQGANKQDLEVIDDDSERSAGRNTEMLCS